MVDLIKGLKRKNYKTDEDYLKAIYRQNQKFVDDTLKFMGYKGYQSFAGIVKGMQLENEIGIVSAVKKVQNTETFTPYVQRAVDNLYIGLKSDTEAFNKLRKATGWHEKFDKSKLKYDKEYGGYFYTGPKGTVFLEFKQRKGDSLEVLTVTQI